MLMGEFHHNIDEKSRLIVPSKFRMELGERVVITKGLDKCLFVYSENEWNKIMQKVSNLQFTKKNVRAFERSFIGGASLIEFDKQGRINITSPLVHYANITKECVIIGVNERLEIWSKEAFDEFMDSNEDTLEEITENLFDSGIYEA
ncbi:MAG: division/cell wall cluster transcriptional repressor MraZ [Bacilli bacterium]|nr:division/cell wall cluster transcriptional repressor MraZ [Bacilli bacterium]